MPLLNDGIGTMDESESEDEEDFGDFDFLYCILRTSTLLFVAAFDPILEVDTGSCEALTRFSASFLSCFRRSEIFSYIFQKCARFSAKRTFKEAVCCTRANSFHRKIFFLVRLYSLIFFLISPTIEFTTTIFRNSNFSPHQKLLRPIAASGEDSQWAVNTNFDRL